MYVVRIIFSCNHSHIYSDQFTIMTIVVKMTAIQVNVQLHDYFG